MGLLGQRSGTVGEVNPLGSNLFGELYVWIGKLRVREVRDAKFKATSMKIESEDSVKRGHEKKYSSDGDDDRESQGSVCSMDYA